MNVNVGKSAFARGAILSIALLLGLIFAGIGVVGASGPAPMASTVTVTAIFSTTAMLNGEPNPEGQPTLAWFEYGTTSAYGSRTPGQNLGSGLAPVPISAPLSGLEPATTYHVRLDVQSASATVLGPDASFTTGVGPTPTTLPPTPAAGRLLRMKVDDQRVGGASAVTCTGPTTCWAVGDTNAGLLVDRDRAGVWSPFSVRSPGPYADLQAINCLTATSCWAVGGYGGRVTLPLAMHYNGRTWAPVPIGVAPGSFAANQLSGVACPTAVDCWAVGIMDGATPKARLLIEHWNGRTWSVEPSPEPVPGGPNYLAAVSCSSVNSCWAVGSRAASIKTDRTGAGLMMHWNGASWTITSTTATGPLSGVTCTWSSACFAVSLSGEILRFVGGNWIKVVAAAPSATTPTSLAAISCSGPTSCWSVGSGNPNFGQIGRPPTEAAMAEFWDGTRWTTASVQAPTGVFAYFNGVTCSVGTSCDAVGVYVASRGTNPGQDITHFFADQTPAQGPPS